MLILQLVWLEILLKINVTLLLIFNGTKLKQFFSENKFDVQVSKFMAIVVANNLLIKKQLVVILATKELM